jgi:hypothetical protein
MVDKCVGVCVNIKCNVVGMYFLLVIDFVFNFCCCCHVCCITL